MTISTTASRQDYTGDNCVKAFAYTFKIPATTDLDVYVNNCLKIMTTDYTVSGAGSATGGTVTFTTAPGCNYTVALVRDVAYTQATAYPENDPFPASSHEDALDKLTMLIQQVRDLATRALRFAVGSVHAATGVLFPDLVANKYFRVNATCTGFDLVDLTAAGTLGLPVAIADGGTAGATAAAARTNLGIGKVPSTPSASTYTILATDMGQTWLHFDRTVAQNFTLPAASTLVAGSRITFLNISGDLAGSGATPGTIMTITTNGADKILLRTGLTTTSLVLPSGVFRRADCVELLCATGQSGYAWVIISGSPEFMAAQGWEDGKIRCTSLVADTVTITPYNGNGITLYNTTTKQWQLYPISNAGLPVLATYCTIDCTNGQSLAAAANIDRNHWIYLFLSGGSPCIEFSRTCTSQEAITGYFCKTGDQTRRLVGGTRYVGSGVGFGLGAQHNITGSYFNRLAVNPSISLGAGTSTGGGWEGMNTFNNCLRFWVWADGAEPLVTLTGSIGQEVSGSTSQIGISVDDEATPTKYCSLVAAAANQVVPCAVAYSSNGISEGHHTFQIKLKTSVAGNDATINADVTLIAKILG